ncbi:hypothetical protein GWN42_06025 [candidate division KSB1 bacterium]|nr:hypothetical protein [candidate division KSB1 bacterium]
MNPPRTEDEVLQAILEKTYRQKENIEVGDQWQQEVMNRVREFGALQPTPSFAEMLEQLVWRLVPVTCLLILGFTVLFAVSDFTSGYEVFQLLLNGTEELTFAQYVGL